jgi:hypothetical protein
MFATGYRRFRSNPHHRRRDLPAGIIGLNEATATKRLAIHDKPGAALAKLVH